MDLNDFNPLVRGYTIMPKTMVCKTCGKVVNFSPFTTITYMGKQRVVENTCDACLQKMTMEGREKLQEWLDKVKRDEYDKKKAMAGRLLQREEEEQKKERERKKKPNLTQDKDVPE